jgi:endonuclease-8
MPEGDSLHRTAASLRVLEGEVVAAESPNPRAAALGVARQIDGKRLERVEAVGKNLLLSFEEGLVLRSHLRMKGRWRVGPAGAPITGWPWLVLRGKAHQAVLSHGPVLELVRGRTSPSVARLGPDIMADPPELDAMVARLRRTDQSRQIGEALLDQHLVAGIGNKWRSEALFVAGTSPWRRLDELADTELRRILEAAAAAMREGRGDLHVYRRSGLPCRRCATPIASRPQGEAARTAYWCLACQAGTAPASA